MSTLHSTLQALIKSSDLRGIMNELDLIEENQSNDWRKKYLQWCARYSDLKNGINKGTLPYEIRSVTHAQLIVSIIELVSEIRDNSEDGQSNAESTFKVLIFPIVRIIDDIPNINYTQLLKGRIDNLNILNENARISIQIYHEEEYKSIINQLTFSNAKRYADQFNASLVIWGNYERASCQQEKYIVNLNYASFLDEHPPFIQTKGRTTIMPDEGFFQLQHGQIKGNLDLIILWTLAYKQYLAGDYSSCKTSLRNCHPSLFASSFFLNRLKGDCLYKLNQFEEAIEAYTIALGIEKESIDTLNNRSLAYSKTQRFKEAIADIDKAFTISNPKAMLYLNRGVIQYRTLERIKKKKEIFIKVEQDFITSLSLSQGKEKAFAYNNLGILYKEQDRWEKSEEALTKGLDCSPDESQLYFNRGQLFLAQDMYEKALADFLVAAEKDPSILMYYFIIAHTYFKLEKYNEGIEILKGLLLIDTNNKDALKTILYGQEKIHGNEQEQIEIIKTLLDLEPENPIELILRLASVFLQIRDYQNALNQYKKVLEKNEGNEAALKGMVHIFQMMKDKSSQIVTLRKLVNLSINEEDLINYLKTLSYLLIKNNEFNEAIEYLNQILSFNPKQVEILKNLAFAYQETGNKEKLIEVLRTILSLGLDDKGKLDIQRQLSSLLLEKQEYHEAIDILNQVLDTNPHQLDILQNLAFAYQETNNKEKLIQIIYRILSHNPKNKINILLQLASLLLGKKEFEEAEMLLIQILKETSNHLPTLNNLLYLYQQTEAFQKEIEILEMLVPLVPDKEIKYLIRIGDLHLGKLKNLNSARASYSRVISIEPENEHAKTNIAYIKQQLGE